MAPHKKNKTSVKKSHTPSKAMAATSALLPKSSKFTSELVGAFDLFHANRTLWLQIEADKKRARDADRAALLEVERGPRRPGFTIFRKLPSELKL